MILSSSLQAARALTASTVRPHVKSNCGRKEGLGCPQCTAAAPVPAAAVAAAPAEATATIPMPIGKLNRIQH